MAVFRTAVAMTKYGPKSELSPSIGDPCRLCGCPLACGDFTTLVTRDVGARYADRPAEVHWQCATAVDDLTTD